MREINECTAEIFRRSEKRIKERRRNRNRILALCIPSCLIVIVWSVMILPEMMPAMRIKENAAEETIGYAEAIVCGCCSYTAVEIQNFDLVPEYYEEVTDKVAVTKIFSAVHSLLTDVDGSYQNADENYNANEANGHNDLTGPTSKLKGYTIIFTTEDGLQTVYNLSKNTLLNVNTNETAVLSDAQVAELMTVLGISE